MQSRRAQAHTVPELARSHHIGHTSDLRIQRLPVFDQETETFMKNVSAFALGILLALMSAVSALADFRAGADAAAKGDFATAMSEWKTAAAAGDAEAQYNL